MNCEFQYTFTTFLDQTHKIIGEFPTDLFMQDSDLNIWIQQTVNEKYRRAILIPDNEGNYFLDDIPFRKFEELYAENISFAKNKYTIFNTGSGLIIYNRNIQNSKNAIFSTLIRKIFVANKLIYNGCSYDSALTKIEIPYKENSIKFEFSSLFFEDFEKTLYSYKLEGFENEWSEWSLNTEKEFTNLTEGDYVFKVKSKNIYGYESSISEFSFRILPPWYRTTLAIIAYIIFSILFIFLVVKIFTRKLKKDKQRLEKIVAERTKEILVKNAILAQQNEEIQTQADNLIEINRMLAEKNEEINQQNEEINAQSENLMLANEQITQQKQELEKALENLEALSKIGQSITKHLSSEKIIETVYQNLGKLFKMDVYAIGLYNNIEQTLDFDGAKENNITLPFFSDNLDDNERLSVICFNQQQEILINNYFEEFSIYFPEYPLPKIGDITNSIIYLPLLTSNKKIGVITVQSFSANAYNQNQFETLKSLSNYISIALENALIFNEINEKKKIIEEKNISITSSINYASRIQSALLPDNEILNQAFLDYFVFWKPRDIVSGDFYWLRIVNNHRIIAVADCTGHGIPGAFVSLLGIAFLNDIVYKKEVTQAAQVLNLLRENVKKSLNQRGFDREQKDGMDIALCVINNQTNEIQFAGANLSLTIIRKSYLNKIAEQLYSKNLKEFVEGEFILNQIIGDTQPIGVYLKESSFTNNVFKYSEGDTIYLFTDGFQDQLGGEQKVKFMSKRLKKLLLNIQDKTMNEQMQIIENEFYTWKNNFNQTDDVLIVGFEI